MHKISHHELFHTIKARLKGRIVIACIGNELRGDDGFGPYVAEALKGRIEAHVLNCGTALENYYNPIVKKDPDVIILLDAVDFEGPYGGIAAFDKEDILKLGFSTHNISPRIFMEFLEKSVEADIFMVGARPRTTAFGEGLSAEIKEAAEKLIEFFVGTIPIKDK